MNTTIYALILLSSFLFLLYGGLVKEHKDRYYGLLAGFFILLMTGLISFVAPVSYVTETIQVTDNNTTTETYVYTPISNNFLYYIFNMTLILVSIGGLYRVWFENKIYKWGAIDNE